MAGWLDKIAKHRNIIVIVAVLAIVSIFLVVPNLSTIGITTLSCDNVQYETTDPHYEDGDLSCVIAFTSSAKEIAFTFGGDIGGITLSDTGYLSGSLAGSPCSYKFSNETNYLYKYNIRKEVSVSSSTGKYYCALTNSEISTIESTTNSKYLGHTPVSCKSDCFAYKPNELLGGCEYVFQQTVGAIHYLDPSIFDNFQANLTMTKDGQEDTVQISHENPTARTDTFTVEYLFAGKGQQTCPAQPDTSIFISNENTATPLSYHSKFNADAVLQDQLTLVDVNTIVSRAASHNLLVEQYLASSGSTGQYCDIETTEATSLLTASLSCKPTGTTSVHVMNVYVNAKEFSIVIPSGTPEIISTEVKQTTAATKSTITVTGKNNGEGDSFDFAVKCAGDQDLFATREYLAAGETKDVDVVYEKAGQIKDCTVTMTSVNSPDKVDSETVKLSITPFCAKSAPSPAHVMIFTEYGCAFICPNYGNSTDVFDSSCGVITDYDRCEYMNDTCVKKKSYIGYHCTGEGTYMKMDNYLEDVNDGKIQAFIPQSIPHKYFVTTFDSKPVCLYLDEYGYIDGQPVNSLVFDYALAPTEATESAKQSSSDTTIPEVPTEAPAGTPTGENLTQWFIYIGGAIGIVIGAWAIWNNYSKKKRR